MLQDDYIMRQIEAFVRMLAHLVLDKGAPAKEFIGEQEFLSEEENFAVQLFKMLHFGEINEAENLLFEQLEDDPSEAFLPIATGFYDTLEKMDDSFLEASGFSREEIAEGRDSVRRLFETDKNTNE